MTSEPCLRWVTTSSRECLIFPTTSLPFEVQRRRIGSVPLASAALGEGRGVVRVRLERTEGDFDRVPAGRVESRARQAVGDSSSPS